MLNALEDNQKAMLLSLMGYTAFAWSDCAIKWVAPHYPSLQISAIQTGIGAVCLFFCARFLGGWKGARNKKELRFHITRAVLNITVSLLVIYSFTILSLASIYSMIFAKPFLAAVLAIIFYKERVNLPRWAAIVAGFIGVLVILQPTPENFKAELLIPLGAAVLIAVMFVTSRSLKESSPFVMSFYPLVGTCILALPFVYIGTPDLGALFSEGTLAFKPSQPLQLGHIPYFVAGAVFSGIGVLCVSLAFRIGSAASVAPFLYSEMIWGLIFGLVIFGDIPDALMLLGTLIIVGSGLYLILIERWRRPMIAAAPASAIPPPKREKQNPQPWNFFHHFFHKRKQKKEAKKEVKAVKKTEKQVARH